MPHSGMRAQVSFNGTPSSHLRSNSANAVRQTRNLLGCIEAGWQSSFQHIASYHWGNKVSKSRAQRIVHVGVAATGEHGSQKLTRTRCQAVCWMPTLQLHRNIAVCLLECKFVVASRLPKYKSCMVLRIRLQPTTSSTQCFVGNTTVGLAISCMPATWASAAPVAWQHPEHNHYSMCLSDMYDQPVCHLGDASCNVSPCTSLANGTKHWQLYKQD
jgi:hypothetical protein